MDKETLFEMSADQLEELKPIGDVFDLTGKVAVVTGTVGLAMFVIHRLCECGAKVVFGGRSPEWGEAMEALMRQQGYEASYRRTDVQKVEECYALVELAEQRYGTVDIVVPVAATWGARAFVDVQESEWDDILATDLKGQYFVCQAAARSMIRGKKGGKIVTIASVAARGEDLVNMGMMTPYNAAKAGVTGITRGMARELKQYGINVNCVAPGGMVTAGAIANNVRAAELYGPEWNEAVMANGEITPVAATPDEVALMVLTLCTDVSNFMYGQVVEVDGGSQFSFQQEPWSYTMEGGKHA